ncbi:MAG TPA: SDR family oxidoreductase [Paracoccus solventivorans]|uniref:SDR family oxidoreductase n=1 Tax=Paracoccus solventivorans TaxID=53463 RepID=A0A832QXS8_9RHOB|nr:SDR family oxidoreductase [Paracoccus solventivorans]HHW35326.1 SDR family oxidoreductase [Paracoccus solventivorans]
MKLLVTGASGLIGQSVCTRLAADGHEVWGATRGAPRPGQGAVAGWLRMDFARPDPAGWRAQLQGFEAVVNCVGVLQDSPREDTAAAHDSGAEALFRACAEAGVRRVLHFSAIGVDRHQLSGFSASKLAGDRALMALDLDWVILRPSVVLGGPVYGASALIRGLAALPLLPVMPATGPLQVVTLEDVAETVAFLIRPDAPARLTLELAGPERLSFAEVVARHRAWLGWRPARRIGVPGWLAGLLYRLGDAAARLGWRPPLRSTARREITQGAVGDPAPWMEATGIFPLSLSEALARRPVSVQERWFAPLYVIKPVLMVVLVLFWTITAVISLTTGYHNGVELMHRAGTGPLAGPGVVAGALADLAVGLSIAWRPSARRGLWAAIALSAFYIVTGTLLLPELWNEPLGPLLKIWPILMAHFVALAILDER